MRLSESRGILLFINSLLNLRNIHRLSDNLIVIGKLFSAWKFVKWLRENTSIRVLITDHCIDKLLHLFNKFLVGFPLFPPSFIIIVLSPSLLLLLLGGFFLESPGAIITVLLLSSNGLKPVLLTEVLVV